jgi:hypothetical protein
MFIGREVMGRIVCKGYDRSSDLVQHCSGIILSRPSTGVTYKDIGVVLVTGFICFTSSHNKIQSLKISSSTRFAIELALLLEHEFLLDHVA